MLDGRKATMQNYGLEQSSQVSPPML